MIESYYVGVNAQNNNIELELDNHTFYLTIEDALYISASLKFVAESGRGVDNE